MFGCTVYDMMYKINVITNKTYTALPLSNLLWYLYKENMLDLLQHLG